MSFWTIRGVMTRTIRHFMGNDEWVEVRRFGTVTRRPITMGDVVTLADESGALDIIPMELPELPNIEAFLKGEC